MLPDERHHTQKYWILRRSGVFFQFVIERSVLFLRQWNEDYTPCRLVGGINPKAPALDRTPGIFRDRRLAGGEPTYYRLVRPSPSQEAAASQALAGCKRRGGRNPRVKAQWVDGSSPPLFKKHRPRSPHPFANRG